MHTSRAEHLQELGSEEIAIMDQAPFAFEQAIDRVGEIAPDLAYPQFVRN